VGKSALAGKIRDIRFDASSFRRSFKAAFFEYYGKYFRIRKKKSLSVRRLFGGATISHRLEFARPDIDNEILRTT
jgi:hypothetical protein